MKTSGKNKFITFIKANYKALLLFFALLLLNVFLLCSNFFFSGLTFGKTFAFILIGSILLEIFLCVIIFISKQKDWKIEKVFLLFGLVIGIVYVFAIPIGRAPDEVSHFTRVYELSNGHFISDIDDDGTIGSVEASNIEIIRDFKENNVTYAEIFENLDLYPDESDQTFIETSAYSYNIVSYLPHVIGMSLGKLLHLPLLATVYLAKIFNLVACIAVLYFSIKYIPFLKNFIFLIAFFPITMQAMSSLSPDGLLIATSFALISFVLYSIYETKELFSKKHFLLMFTICFFLSMCKIAYAPLCLLLFAIPKERFGSAKKKIAIIIGTGAIIFTFLLVWLLIAPSLQSQTDQATQIGLILSNPLKYFAIILNSINTNIYMYLSNFLGGYLEWFNVLLSPLYIISTFTIFVLLCSKEKTTVTKSLKYLAIAIFTIITILIFTTMFITWTKAGELVIDGVQGRYFLPLALLIPIIFLPTEKSPKKVAKITPSQNYYLYGFIVFESIYAITAIACTHL